MYVHERGMSFDEIVGAAQILPQMGSKLPHLGQLSSFGAALFVSCLACVF